MKDIVREPQILVDSNVTKKEEQKILNAIYPFGLPEQEVVEGTYLIKSDKYQMSIGRHQTSSSTLLAPVIDGKFLVPGVALQGRRSSLDICVLTHRGIPFTQLLGRSHALWWGKNVVNLQSDDIRAFTPEKGEKRLDELSQIKKIYLDGLAGESMNIELLDIHLSKMLGGFWKEYYLNTLPSRIVSKTNKEEVTLEVENLFVCCDQNIREATNTYRSLSAEDRLLLDKSFKIVFERRMSIPFVYMEPLASYYIQNGTLPSSRNNAGIRSPLEIQADTRGTATWEIDTVYLPDEIRGTEVEKVAMAKLADLGLETKVQDFSDLDKDQPRYETCLDRYDGSFTWDTLKKVILNGEFVPVI